MSDVRLIHSTIDSETKGRTLAKRLVEEQLVACVNLGPEVSSYYRWDGELQEEEEFQLTIKTDAEIVGAAVERLEELHPYDCPEILVTRVSQASTGYEDWVKKHSSP
ncbi:MAG: divalent-cation tolerance protein CutA [bacterium]